MTNSLQKSMFSDHWRGRRGLEDAGKYCLLKQESAFLQNVGFRCDLLVTGCVTTMHMQSCYITAINNW